VPHENAKASLADPLKRGRLSGYWSSLANVHWPEGFERSMSVWQLLGRSPMTVHLGKIPVLFGCGRTVVYRAIHGDAASSTRQAGDTA
jgi:hypothetical protein